MNARRAKPRKDGDLVMLPLGGAGEIGMNMYLYGLGNARKRKWLMVDCGVKFGDERDPGIDLILPDTSFIEAERHNLLGIVLTHAHEDHLGAVPRLWSRLRAPVFCSPFAAELLKGKLAEEGLLGTVKLNVVPMGARFELGPFDVEFIAVTHSIPEPNALALRTAAGLVVHSGDWKLDRTPAIPPEMDETRFRQLGEEGVRALVCDSTNILRDGFSPSEADIAEELQRIIAAATDRVAVTTFASHVGRLTTVIEAARKAGREVVLAGRAMRNVVEAARAVGLLSEAGSLLEEDAFQHLPRARTLLLCTGSQGEGRAAMARIAAGTHPAIALDPGDLAIFSSKTIPGNEKAVGAVINDLAAQGVGVITSDDALVHTSGHPRREEVREVYGWLRPELVVPMHGEMRHLVEHVEFARDCGVPEAMMARNGETIRLAPGPAAIVDEAPTGRLHVDGRLIVPSVEGPARYRRKLSFAGVVLVSVVLGKKGEIVTDPAVTLDGLPQTDGEGEAMEDILYDAVLDALEDMSRVARRDGETVVEKVRNAVRRAAANVWGKRPICHVQVHRV